jgi:hypothetical protein
VQLVGQPRVLKIATDSSARCHNTFASLKLLFSDFPCELKNMICIYRKEYNRVTEREMGVKMCTWNGIGSLRGTVRA